ncbi:MAG: leucine-rich repeat domain-containing protein, partial [Oscillospiraceae bacterium]|nr:leucine-rich repeat domain-containing protein [Oscillospiraceae bacterium]
MIINNKYIELRKGIDLMKRASRTLLTVFLCLILCTVLLNGQARAADIVASGTCGADGSNLTWTLDENGQLTISGTGAMADYTASPWYDCGSSFTSVVLVEGVTSIGNAAFYSCSGLTSVTIPDTLTSIGEYAFCDSSGLTSVTIPEGVSSIGDYAFYGCSGLTSVTIPSSVTSIGSSAFSGCSSLPEIGVSPNNLNYCSLDGILFNQEKTWLIVCPAGNTGSCTIPGNVTSIGDNAFFDCSGLTSVTIPGSVTSIGNSAFRNCSGLTSVTIPGSVTNIGWGVFYGCRGLTSVTIPEGMTRICDEMFAWCTSLMSVTIPNSVTSIGGSAFYYCTSLTSVTIPEGITSIGDFAFNGCTGLTDVYYGGTEEEWEGIQFGSYNTPLLSAHLHPTEPAGPSIIDSGTCGDNLAWTLYSDGYLHFQGSGSMQDYSESSPAPWYQYREQIDGAVFSDDVTTIGGYAFRDCSSMRSVQLPSSLVSIGDEAFYNCSSLTGISLPESVTDIGIYAFYKCSALTEFTIPTGVTAVNNGVFCYCTGLIGITIPDGVTSVGNSAFAVCSSLTGVTIPEGVTSISEYAFNGCSSLTSVTIPESVMNIGWYAFNNCSSLTSVTIPESVMNIGWYAFNNCSSLTSVRIPGSVTSIGAAVFCDCSSLTSVTIPEGVTSIGESAFSGCTRLTGVMIPASVTNIGGYAFSYCSSLTDIWYSGTESQWYEITKGEGNTALSTAELHAASNLGSGKCGDDVDWVLYSDGRLIISGSGAMTSAPWQTELYKSIRTVTIGSGVTDIYDYSFMSCSALTAVTIPDTVTAIGEYVFYKCTALESVTLPDSLISIGGYAFDRSGITSLTIPAGVSSMGTGIFYGCSALTTAGPIGSGSSIEFGWTESIPGLAFCDSCLTSVLIPAGMTSIGWGAFDSCRDLKTVTIPQSMVSISDRAFNGCSSLANIYYGGTEAEWDEISIGSNNDPLQNARLHYHEHSCDALVWTWAADHSSASAAGTCSECGKDFTVDAVITSTTNETTCTESGQTIYTATVTFGGKTYTDNKTVEIPATGHTWGAATYEWSADDGSVTATRACANDPSHVETETVQTTRSVKTPATCTAAGEAEYTAVFENTAFEPQTKTVEIPATGHAWGAVNYEWSADNGSVTATRACANDPNHVETETVQTTRSVKTPATCAAAGEVEYTAVFENAAFVMQTKTEEIPKLPHSYGEPIWTWSDGYDTALALFSCGQCGDIRTVQASITSVGVDPTCTEAGETVYAASVEFGGEIYTNQKTKTIPALGHAWGAVNYVWSADNGSVTATRACSNDPSHVETETVQTTRSVKTHATCTAAGEAEYTAVFENTAFEKQTKTVEIPKLPHDYGEPEWAWVANHTTAMAIFTCEGCGDSQTVRASITMSTKEASCTQTGAKIYTASVTFGGETYTDEQTETIPATGHTPGDPVRENEVAASCAAAGSYDEVTYCTVCHEELSRTTKTIDKLPHTPGEPVREKEVAATCAAAGSYDEVTYCTVCHEELSRETKTIDKLPHAPGEPVRENEIAATCAAAGSYDEVTYCTVCGEELSRETKTIDNLPHTPGEPVREKEVAATCAAAGSYDEVTYCTVCHEELSRTTKTIDKLPQTPGEPVREKEVAATCTAAGSYDEVTYCTVCGEELSRETKPIDKLDHTPGEPVRENEVAATCK